MEIDKKALKKEFMGQMKAGAGQGATGFNPIALMQAAGAFNFGGGGGGGTGGTGATGPTGSKKHPKTPKIEDPPLPPLPRNPPLTGKPASNSWEDIVGFHFPGGATGVYKEGGLVRGCGSAQRGRGRGKFV